jgi:hypothetical protein
VQIELEQLLWVLLKYFTDYSEDAPAQNFDCTSVGFHLLKTRRQSPAPHGESATEGKPVDPVEDDGASA